MIIVIDPSNVSTREVIKVSREVTETIPLIYTPQAPLEMVLMKPLKPRPRTHDDRARVDKVDKSNAEIVELKDDKSNIAKGTESQIDDVAKIERDKASEAKTNAVAEIKTAQFLRNAIQKQMWKIDRGPTATAAAVSGSLQQYGRCSLMQPCTACSTTCC